MIDALAEARRRGLTTIAMVGYDGGRIAAEGLADHVVVTRSQHIPRIQEAQASAYHVLRELVEQRAMSIAAAHGPRVRASGCARGHRAGRRLPAVRLPARHRARAGRLRAERRARRAARGRGRRRGGRRGSSRRLPAEAPPLALVERVATERARAPRGERGFAIVESARAGEPDALVAPDTATCEECLAELFDPADRRYRYPFINCTNCGPRFTIVRGVPYDRPLTTMAGFEMCDACRAEYEDPRRPPLPRPAERLPGVRPARCGSSAADARSAATRGGARRAARRAIVAVKGIGGFHLACRADDERAVAALRARKHREDKPFALMAPTSRRRARWSSWTRREEALLARPRAPDRARAAPCRRAGRAVGRAAVAGARRDAALLPAPPPAAGGRRRCRS